jgi:penicillin-binding protein activator
MKKYSILLILSFLVVFSACKTKKVTRIDPTEQTDLSGRWNDTDSRLVSNEMITDALNRPWRTDYLAQKGKKPTVIVGLVKNKTSEFIEPETFIKDIERAFINSGLVSVVQGGEAREEMRKEKADQQTNASVETMKKFGREKGADFFMTGVITSITDQNGKNKVVYYQINLELTNIETNEKVWIGDKKIKKAIVN